MIIKSRFAPSPTGEIHLGTLYTCFFVYIISDHMILRIEDTDQSRSKDIYTDNILNTLKLMNITYSKIVYQSKNIQNHLHIANILLEKNLAYKALGDQDDKKWIENQEYFNNKDNYVIRLNSQQIINDEFVTFYDEVYGELKYSKKDLDDMIIVRSNKTPTYNLCVVVDDHEENINYIIRGNDHITNTFKQVLIYKALKWEVPKYIHLPLIESMQGGKLSKRKDSISILSFLKDGFIPIAILNMLFLLGSSSEKEILSIEEMKKNIQIKNISKSSAKFDTKKLKFINIQHIKTLTLTELKNHLTNFITINDLDTNPLKILSRDHMLPEFIKRSHTLRDIYQFCTVYYDTNAIIDYTLIKEFDLNILELTINNLFLEKDWSIDNLTNTMKSFAKNNNFKIQAILMPLRILITNTNTFPSFFDILVFWGRQESKKILIKRLSSLKENLI